jgi:hypothetical protein
MTTVSAYDDMEHDRATGKLVVRVRHYSAWERMPMPHA